MAAVTASCAARPTRTARVPRGRVKQARSTSHVTLTRRGRAVVAVLAVMLAALLVASVAALVLGPTATPAAAGLSSAKPALSTLTVRSGDTLWSIADRIAPNADPRETITAIREVNNLSSASVYAGQRLIVPTGH